MIRVWRRTHVSVALIVTTVALSPYAAAQPKTAPRVIAVCAPCHGYDGRSANVETPNLAGQPGIYLREQLLAFRAGGRRHPRMRGLARDLTDREINDIVGYYSILPPP
jgi:cytochrome c553